MSPNNGQIPQQSHVENSPLAPLETPKDTKEAQEFLEQIKEIWVGFNTLPKDNKPLIEAKIKITNHKSQLLTNDGYPSLPELCSVLRRRRVRTL